MAAAAVYRANRYQSSLHPAGSELRCLLVVIIEERGVAVVALDQAAAWRIVLRRRKRQGRVLDRG